MSLIIGHTTAQAFYRSQSELPSGPRYPLAPSPLKSDAPTPEAVDSARQVLLEWGVRKSDVQTLDVIVSDQSQRRTIPGAQCHVCTSVLPAGSLIRLDTGLFIVDPRLCALQAARYLDPLELVEYYYELCGAYHMPDRPEEAYRVHQPFTTTDQLSSYMRAAGRVPMVRQALWAVRYTRDGARSPMETASVMTIVLPKRLGGLGIRTLSMDRPIAVTGSARRMTRRRAFYADAFIESAGLLIEYMGVFHEESSRQVDDSERDHALDAMGYHVVRIWRGALFNVVNYRRILYSIRQRCKLPPSRFPDDFDDRQEELRRFVVRHWC